MDNLLIVDGHYLLFQMFYGMPSRIMGKSGKPVHAVIGFTGALLKAVKLVNATKCAVIFDGETPNFRTEINDDYKANRDYTYLTEEENPFNQLDDVKKVLNFLGIKNKEITENYETDDVIASFAYSFKDKCKIYIMSADTDYLQLVCENVNVLNYRGKNSTILTKDTVYEKYGVYPSSFADYKCLVGDNADNVKGIYGIGPKTAIKLLEKYENTENILRNANNIENERLKNMIINGKDTLIMNKRLIKLDKKAEIPFKLEELSFKLNEDTKTNTILKNLNILE